MYSQSPKITIQLKKGDITHQYMSLRSKENLKFFPEDSIGGRNEDQQGKLLSVYFEGLDEIVETDISSSTNYFRKRSEVRRFFNHHNLKEGDEIIIEKLSDYSYKVYPKLLPFDENKEINRIRKELDLQGFFNSKKIEEAIKKILVSIAERKGQRKFRTKLLKAYQGRCAITGFNAEQALEAAHIRPYQGEDTSETWNGLLLRADIHTLFDLNLITVHPDTKEIIIAPELRSTDYSHLEGKKLRLPKDNNLYLKTFAVLQWHYKQCEWV